MNEQNNREKVKPKKTHKPLSSALVWVLAYLSVDAPLDTVEFTLSVVLLLTCLLQSQSKFIIRKQSSRWK